MKQGVFVRKSSGRPAVTEGNVERIQQSFICSPRKSIPWHSLESAIPKSTVHKALHKKLKLHTYKIQLLHEIKAADKPMRKEFAEHMLETIDSDPNFMHNIMSTNEATFRINGCINRRNYRIWGSKKTHVTHEFVRDSPKLNVWCGLIHDHIFGPFVFAENTIDGRMFLDMLELFLFPQVDDLPNAVHSTELLTTVIW
jgi:hypothetical protein